MVRVGSEEDARRHGPLHEPYFESYLNWNMRAAFEGVGLSHREETPAFLSKVAAFAKP